MPRVLEDRDWVLVHRESSVSPQPSSLVVQYCPELRRAVHGHRRCQAWDRLPGW